MSKQVSAQATAELKRIAGIGRALLAQHGKSWRRFGSIDLGLLHKRGQTLRPGTVRRIQDLHREAMADSDLARLDLMTYAFLSGASVEGIACLSYAVSKECAKESGMTETALTPADVKLCKEELRKLSGGHVEYTGCQWPDPEGDRKVAGPLVCKYCRDRKRGCFRCIDKQASEVDALLYGERVFTSRDLVHDGCIIRENIPAGGVVVAGVDMANGDDRSVAVVRDINGVQNIHTITMRIGKPADDMADALALSLKVWPNINALPIGQEAKRPMPERAPRYIPETDGVARTPAANFDGSPHDLLGPPKPKPAPIPLKVPAKVHSHNTGFWMQRAVRNAAAPRDIRHVLLDGFE